jgi:hypothetical protein
MSSPSEICWVWELMQTGRDRGGRFEYDDFDPVPPHKYFWDDMGRMRLESTIVNLAPIP